MKLFRRAAADDRRLLIALYRRTKGDLRLLVHFGEVHGLNWDSARACAAGRRLLDRGLARGEVVAPVGRPAGWLMLTPAGSEEAARLLTLRRRCHPGARRIPRELLGGWWARLLAFLSRRSV
jgi:hypothetical protein